MPRAKGFWHFVTKTDACWLFVGGLTEDGYGVYMDHQVAKRAHRHAYEVMVGPIPEGLQLDHLCRVRNCVNPDHLEPVTPRENTLRGFGITAVNAAKTHCKNDHEFTAENTYVRPDGARTCRACRVEVQARYYRKQRVA
jgi:hypothetical protein